MTNRFNYENNSVRILNNNSSQNEIENNENVDIIVTNRGGRKRKAPGELKDHRRTVYTSFGTEDPMIEEFLRGREFSVVMRELLFKAIEGEK